MSVAVNISVAKSASAADHAEAREVGARVIACAAALNREAEALGLEITTVNLRHVPPVEKAAPPPLAKPAGRELRWPADLTDPNWRP